MGDHSTNVIPFNFGKQQVRTLLVDDQPWFVAKDVIASLEYAKSSNPARVVDHVPAQWKGVNPIHTPGGTQNILMLSEQGLYFFIGRSDKPKALPFQMWLAGEVLPAIRKYGRYEDTQKKMTTMMSELIGMTEINALKGLARHKASALPVSIQRSATARIYSAMHTRFSVSRLELIPAGQFEAACNFVAAYSVHEGEYIPRQAHLLPEKLGQDERYLVSADPHGNKQVMPVPMDAYVLNRREFMKSMLVDEDMPVSTEEMFQFVAWATENLRRRSLHQVSRRAVA